MFDVTLINLQPDLAAAVPDLGAHHVGEIEEPRLLALLNRFRRVNPIENHDAEPQIVIRTGAGKFLVRTRHEKLFLYDSRDSTIPYLELAAEEILAELKGRTPTTDAPTENTAPVRKKTPHRAIALSILVAGLLLNAYTVYSVFQAESINQKPEVGVIADATELSALQQSVAGKYATGEAIGDRVIAIEANGRVSFFKITSSGRRLDFEDQYRIGRHNSILSLVTHHSGVVEILNIDSLTYCRDAYRRAR